MNSRGEDLVHGDLFEETLTVADEPMLVPIEQVDEIHATAITPVDVYKYAKSEDLAASLVTCIDALPKADNESEIEAA